MAISKSAKDRGRDRKGQDQNHRTAGPAEGELEQKKVEAENSEIVDIVRGMSIPLPSYPWCSSRSGLGPPLGQNVPKSETEDKEGYRMKSELRC